MSRQRGYRRGHERILDPELERLGLVDAEGRPRKSKRERLDEIESVWEPKGSTVKADLQAALTAGGALPSPRSPESLRRRASSLRGLARAVENRGDDTLAAMYRQAAQAIEVSLEPSSPKQRKRQRKVDLSDWRPKPLPYADLPQRVMAILERRPGFSRLVSLRRFIKMIGTERMRAMHLEEREERMRRLDVSPMDEPATQLLKRYDDLKQLEQKRWDYWKALFIKAIEVIDEPRKARMASDEQAVQATIDCGLSVRKGAQAIGMKQTTYYRIRKHLLEKRQASEVMRPPTHKEERQRLVEATRHLPLKEAQAATGIPRRTLSRLRGAGCST